jgi:hypothetical protein
MEQQKLLSYEKVVKCYYGLAIISLAKSKYNGVISAPMEEDLVSLKSFYMKWKAHWYLKIKWLNMHLFY